MREINPNLDKESQAQMFQIVAREAIENLEKDKIRNDTVYKAQGNLEKMILALENRVKILEEARQKQIALNSTFIQKGITEAKAETKSSKPKGFWDWLK